MIIHDIFEDERQLIEGQELSGYVDVQTLVHLLPSVSSPRDFENAVDKLRLGQESSMTLAEKLQLALAFISLFRANRPQKQLIIRNLMGVQAAPAQNQEVEPQRNAMGIRINQPLQQRQAQPPPQG